jgi:hypothetical protein
MVFRLRSGQAKEVGRQISQTRARTVTIHCQNWVLASRNSGALAVICHAKPLKPLNLQRINAKPKKWNKR